MTVAARCTASNDRGVASAAAQMRRRARCGERFFDFRDGRRGDALQQLGGLDHHAVLAEAAQRRLLLDPGLLDGVKRLLSVGLGQALLLRPSCGEPFERRDFLAGRGRERRYAGTNLLAVEQDRTGSALGQSAAELRSRTVRDRFAGRRAAGCRSGAWISRRTPLTVIVAMKTPYLGLWPNTLLKALPQRALS